MYSDKGVYSSFMEWCGGQININNTIIRINSRFKRNCMLQLKTEIKRFENIKLSKKLSKFNFLT